MQIKDSLAVVTGGASGLGEATVRMLSAGGAKVAILDVVAQKGEMLASELGPNVVFCHADVTSDEGSRKAIEKAVEAFGAINVTVNCAGVGDPCRIISKKGLISLDSFNRVIQINLIGTFNLTRLAIEQMVKNAVNEEGERGVIINTASVAAFEGQIGQAAYSSSKAGIVGMTLPVARECADYGIRVMAIAPGLFDTPLLGELPEAIKDELARSVPFPKRLGRPVEYAALVRHILENAMLNGECIRLDGAIRMTAR